MSVSSQVNKHIFQGDGTTRVWGYSFDLPRDARGQPITSVISIVYHKADGTYETRTDFTVNPATKQITFPVSGSAPPTGSKVIVLRLLPLVQLLQLQELGEFKAKTLEYSYDDLEMQIQQLKEAVDRCVKSHIDDPPESYEGELFDIIKNARDRAESAATIAVTAAQTATQKASAAAASATSAANSAATATTKANEAASSATFAEQKALAAQGSASAASTAAETALSTIQNITVWNEDTPYSPPQAVMTDDGTIYRCIEPNINKHPATNPQYWRENQAAIFETFELDNDGDLMPKENPSGSQYFSIDSDGDICPNG